MKKVIIISVIAIVLIGAAFFLFSGEKCPKCPVPGTYSVCDDQAMKTRTNYQCSEDTNFQCESYTEETQCATEISLVGNMNAIIKPSIDEKVNGIIKFEIKTFPEDTQIVAYYLSGGNLDPIGESRWALFAAKQGDIWTGLIDTTEYENGLYEVMVVGTSKETLEGNPESYARGQILIEN